MVKFVQFAYRRMHIPGTNVSPNMLARGRQPVTPNDLGVLDAGQAATAGPAMDEHLKQLKAHQEGRPLVRRGRRR